MPTFLLDSDASRFFRRAFLDHQPQRYALMLPPGRDQKYDDHYGQITDRMIVRHLAGEITLAAPFAWADLANLLPLDIDAGGIAVFRALLDMLRKRGLWAFGQFCPRPNWPDVLQRGYIYVPFNNLVNARRLQQLGADVIAMVEQPGWKVEARAHGADTRLPLGRHTHTGLFGDLVLDEEIIAIDRDFTTAFALLRRAWRTNSVDLLPVSPELPARSGTKPAVVSSGMTIDRFNCEHDIEHLLAAYGARATRKRGLYFCPFHADEHASLQVYFAKRGRHMGQKVCHCLSQHSNCPLAEYGQYDAFNVYIIGEGLTVEDALRRLNGR